MIRPVNDRVAVKKVESQESMVKGLYVPDSAKSGTNKAEIVALGTDEDMLKVLNVGDTVVYSQYGGLQEVEDDGVKYYILNFSDVLCIVD
ncbi:MAG: co-chaperone GroES [Candidatus Zophobacter franzmannii]|nr:co-chaperone GroES [Candidatus Zophobacter franzmannii]